MPPSSGIRQSRARMQLNILKTKHERRRCWYLNIPSGCAVAPEKSKRSNDKSPIALESKNAQQKTYTDTEKCIFECDYLRQTETTISKADILRDMWSEWRNCNQPSAVANEKCAEWTAMPVSGSSPLSLTFALREDAGTATSCSTLSRGPDIENESVSYEYTFDELIHRRVQT